MVIHQATSVVRYLRYAQMHFHTLCVYIFNFQKKSLYILILHEAIKMPKSENLRLYFTHLFIQNTHIFQQLVYSYV